MASAALSLLFVSALVVLPLVGCVIAALGLIPVARYVADGRSGLPVWGSVLVLLTILTVAGGGVLWATLLAAYALVIAIPTAALEVWLRRPWSEGRWAVVATGSGLLLCLGAVIVAVWPEAPVVGIAEQVRLASVEVEELYRAAGVSRARAGMAMDLLRTVVPWILPSLPVAYLVLVLFWIRPRLSALGFPLEVGPFERYRSEEWLPAAFAVGGLGTLATSGTARWVAVNLLVAVLILYFVHGLAIIRAHLARWLGRGWLVRWGVGLVCLHVPLLVSVLGLVDSFVPLRPQALMGEEGHESDSERLR